MLKGKEFWEHLCENLEYRFFAGVPFKEALGLYGSMNIDIMHYVPAANENIAVKLAAGALISGFKSAVILDSKLIDKVDLSFHTKYELPILFISNFKPAGKEFLISNDIDELVNEIETSNRPGVFIIGEE